VAAATDGISLSVIARQLALPPSTVHRLLTTLQEKRLTRFDLKASLWFIGVQAFEVGNAFARTRNLAPLARPHMHYLREESGETVSLAVEDQGEAVFLSQVQGGQTTRALAPVGARTAMHCSGIGKALLAHIRDAHLADILEQRGLRRLTATTLTNPQNLQQELGVIRARGYAIDDQEHLVGLRCVAASIFDENGEAVAAISASGPAARIGTERIAFLGDLVRRVAGNVSRDFGGRI
jgi:IclR family acetate operon transcriptional repressor